MRSKHLRSLIDIPPLPTPGVDTAPKGPLLPPPLRARACWGGSQRPPGEPRTPGTQWHRKAHTRQQHVARGQDWSGRVFRVPGGPSLGTRAVWPSARRVGHPPTPSISYTRFASQPKSLSARERRSARLHPSSPRAEGFMRESPFCRRGRSSREAFIGTPGHGPLSGGGWPWDPTRRPPQNCG